MGIHLAAEVANALLSAWSEGQGGNGFVDQVGHWLSLDHLTKERASLFIVDYYQKPVVLKRRLRNIVRFTTRRLVPVQSERMTIKRTQHFHSETGEVTTDFRVVADTEAKEACSAEYQELHPITKNNWHIQQKNAWTWELRANNDRIVHTWTDGTFTDGPTIYMATAAEMRQDDLEERRAEGKPDPL